jgi:hypothetical protein
MGLDILRANLADKVVERRPGLTFGVKDHAGYWMRIGGKKVFVVHAHQFRAWFANVRQWNLVLDSLAAKSVSHHWPDRSFVRCFEFADPFPRAHRQRFKSDCLSSGREKGTLGA